MESEDGKSGKSYRHGLWWSRRNMGIWEHTSSGGPLATHSGTLMAGAQSNSEFDPIMINIPMISGYAPDQRQKAIGAMLKKKKALFWLNKLIMIVIFETYFYWMNKMLGWLMMDYVKKNLGNLHQSNMEVGIPQGNQSSCQQDVNI